MAEINLNEASRKDLTGAGTPEVGAPTVEEMKAAGERGASKRVEREEPAAPGTESSRRVLPGNPDELDREGMAGYRQGDAVLGSEGNTN